MKRAFVTIRDRQFEVEYSSPSDWHFVSSDGWMNLEITAAEEIAVSDQVIAIIGDREMCSAPDLYE